MQLFLSDAARFIRANGRWLAGGFLLTFFSSFGQTFFIGLSGNDLRAQYNLSGGEFGGLYMLATLASALSLPWLGRTLDFLPGWKVTLFSLPLLAAGCLLVPFAPHVALLGIALYLLRLFGQGMMSEIAFTETGRWFAADRGRATALVSMGVWVGSALLPVTVVLITNFGGWKMAWVASATIIMLIGLPAITKLISVERTPQADDEQASRLRTGRDWTMTEVIRDPVLYLLLIGILAPPFIGTTIFFHQGYLITLRDYDPLVFAAAFPLMAVSTIIFGLVCGYLVDRFGSLPLLPWFLLPMALASAAVALITPTWGIYSFMLLLGVSTGFSQTLLGALWPEIYGLANLGGIRAITVSGMVLATALGPGITGLLIDLGVPFPTQMLWMSLWCVLASFALALAVRMVLRRRTA